MATHNDVGKCNVNSLQIQFTPKEAHSPQRQSHSPQESSEYAILERLEFNLFMFASGFSLMIKFFRSASRKLKFLANPASLFSAKGLSNFAGAQLKKTFCSDVFDSQE
jgi:hypothetical protein